MKPVHLFRQAQELRDLVYNPVNGLDSRWIIGVTGGFGSGKSSLVNDLELTHSFPVLRLGDKLREHFGDAIDRFAGMAPQASEKIVRGLIAKEHIDCNTRPLVVDGFPRSVEQVVWANANGMKLLTVFVLADRDTRRARIELRSGRPEDSPERIDQEGHLPSFIQQVFELSNRSFFVYNG